MCWYERCCLMECAWIWMPRMVLCSEILSACPRPAAKAQRCSERQSCWDQPAVIKQQDTEQSTMDTEMKIKGCLPFEKNCTYMHTRCVYCHCNVASLKACHRKQTDIYKATFKATIYHVIF